MPTPSKPAGGRKAEIVAVAARLFDERGYTAVGMNDLGSELGMSGPALYWHFPGKEALLAAVVQSAVETMVAVLDTAIGCMDAGEGPPDAGFAALVDLALDEPALLGTLLRERHRLTGDAEAGVLVAEARLVELSLHTFARLHPDLDVAAAGLRMVALLGPLTVVGSADPAIPRRRVRALVLASSTALSASAPMPPSKVAGPGTWRPTVSRREAILHAARDLFRARSFEDVSIDDIGGAAGITGPSVYHHVKSKADLLTAVWEREGMRVVGDAVGALDLADSADDALRRLAGAYVGWALGGIGLVQRVFLERAEDPDSAGSWRRVRPVLVDLWMAALAEVRPDLPEAERRLLVDMAFSVAVFACTAAAGDRTRHDDIVGLVVSFARGIPVAPPS